MSRDVVTLGNRLLYSTRKDMKEEYRKIKDFEHYEVSNFGRVRNTRTGKTLKPISHTGGYRRLKLRDNGRAKDVFIHRLVAQAFIPDPKKEVNHIDGDKTNNHINNLEWVSSLENQTHRFLKVNTSSKYPGVNYIASRNRWRVRLTVSGVRKTIGHYKTELGAFLHYVDACERYGVVNKYLTSSSI